MEVRKGFKQTDAGIIPEDWDVNKLGDCLVGLPDYGINAPAIDFNDSFPAYIRITDITEEGNFSSEKKASVDCKGSDKYFLSKGDIVFARTGASVGKTYLYNPKDGMLAFAGFLIRVKPNPELLLPEYLAGYLRTRSYWNWVQLMSMRSGQPGINGKEYSQLLIPIPSPPEQRAIAAALSDVDTLLIALDELIAKKCLIKQGAMHELLTGKKRLPGFSGEWKTKELGEITEIVSGGTPSTRIDEYWNGNINWCIPTDITKAPGKYLEKTEKRITELGLKNSSATLLPKGTLLLCSRATIGDVKIATDVICTNQGFKSLVCSKQVYNEFLYYVLLTMKSKLIERAIGSTFLEITKKEIALIEIKIPSIPEQTAIAEILSDTDAEIDALETKREKTRLIKQGMMQELLTGRIRLV